MVNLLNASLLSETAFEKVTSIMTSTNSGKSESSGLNVI